MRLNSSFAGGLVLAFLPLVAAAGETSPAEKVPALELRKVKTIATDLAPKSCAVSPDGKTVYVLNLEGMSIQAFDAETKKARWRLKFIPTPAQGWDYEARKPIRSFAEKPVEAAFTEQGRYLWVSLHNGESVVVIDTTFADPAPPAGGEGFLKARLQMEKDEVYKEVSIRRIPVGEIPKVIAVTPDDQVAYVANWHSLSISAIDTRTFQPLKEIRVSSIPRGMAVTPDGKELYATIMAGTQLARIDVATQTLLGYVEIGGNPRHVVASEDGKFLYVTLNGPGDVVKYSLDEDRIVDKVHVGAQPRTLTLSPDGRHLFVVLYHGNKLAVIDARTLEVEGTYSTGVYPVGVAVTPDGEEVWVVNYRSSTLDVFAVEVGSPTPAAPATTQTVH